jgi:hypothetical protein
VERVQIAREVFRIVFFGVDGLLGDKCLLSLA